jgi:D-alanyl-D-alanine carboxypeptidase
MTDLGGRARRHIEALTSRGDLPGIQYRVLGPHGVTFALATGVRDVASGQAMDDSTVQLAYSVTKAITAIAVMQLVERGRLDLDGALTRIYAEHPYGDEITVRQLLAHTSGLPNPLALDWFTLPGQPFDRDATLRQVLAKSGRLAQPPGHAYRYSNLGYWLLEKAIETASGQDYAAFVTEHVFGPVGVRPEAARFSADGPGELAVGHTRRFSPLTLLMRLMTPAAYWSGSRGRWRRSAVVVPYGRAYGGLFTTAAALGAVLEDLLREDARLLGPAAKAALFAPQQTAAGRTIGALGWVIGDLAGERYFGKQGGGLGFHGNVRIYPGRRLATVMLANRTEISPRPIDARSDAIDAIFLRPDGR